MTEEALDDLTDASETNLSTYVSLTFKIRQTKITKQTKPRTMLELSITFNK
jgi:hypothetical protein